MSAGWFQDTSALNFLVVWFRHVHLYPWSYWLVADKSVGHFLCRNSQRIILMLAVIFLVKASKHVLILHVVTLVPSTNFFVGNDFTWLWNWCLVERCGRMNTEELELLSDSKYRNYVAAVDKALKNFEYSSEWADLISALGKLNKVYLSVFNH